MLKKEENRNVESEINDYNVIKEISIKIDQLLGSYQTNVFT